MASRKQKSEKPSGEEHEDGEILEQYLDDEGYLCVDLYRDGVRESVRVDRLVAEAFLPRPWLN